MESVLVLIHFLQDGFVAFIQAFKLVPSLQAQRCSESLRATVSTVASLLTTVVAHPCHLCRIDTLRVPVPTLTFAHAPAALVSRTFENCVHCDLCDSLLFIIFRFIRGRLSQMSMELLASDLLEFQGRRSRDLVEDDLLHHGDQLNVRHRGAPEHEIQEALQHQRLDCQRSPHL